MEFCIETKQQKYTKPNCLIYVICKFRYYDEHKLKQFDFALLRHLLSIFPLSVQYIWLTD